MNRQHGNQDYNYFLVRLKNSEDRDLLEVGSVVELKE